MLNSERPITAMTAAWQPGLLDRWDLPSKYFQPIATELETVYII